MKKPTKVKLITKLITFEFINLFDEELIQMKYNSNNEAQKNGKARKIHKDSQGKYFTHYREKIYFTTANEEPL